MAIQQKIHTVLHNKRILWIKLTGTRLFRLFPDKWAVSIIYHNLFGKPLNLDNPQSFSEKIQWLKLNDHNPIYTRLVDKYNVKEWVAQIVGQEFVIPTYGVWDSFDAIDFSRLPNQFVLKTTHGGGNSGVVICRDKKVFDFASARIKLTRSLKTDTYMVGREWPYKFVPRRIIAEEYIAPTSDSQDLPDYKWFCFGGEPKYCQVIQNRSSIETVDFFDTDWNHQDFIGLNFIGASCFQNALTLPSRPIDLSIQVDIAKKLSKGLPFARIDLYSLPHKTYFGEITFYPASGFGFFKPESINDILGKMIVLPTEKDCR